MWKERAELSAWHTVGLTECPLPLPSFVLTLGECSQLQPYCDQAWAGKASGKWRAHPWGHWAGYGREHGPCLHLLGCEDDFTYVVSFQEQDRIGQGSALSCSGLTPGGAGDLRALWGRGSSVSMLDGHFHSQQVPQALP
jgi:hypothetical protein